jgi:putative pyruvate formate lyase activating enzyme
MNPTNEDPVFSRFTLEGFEAAYRSAHRAGKLPARVDRALASLEQCCTCPRECGVNRIADEKRACFTGRYARVASFGAHHGEEDCLRGRYGSGTIFFCQCNLRCVFCQNADISHHNAGPETRPEEIAGIMLRLQREGCHNINFVTPGHVLPQLVEAIACAVERGLTVPIVYNTGGYDSVASLELLDGLVDIYMPDLKFWTGKSAARYAGAADYPQRARAAIAEMSRQVGPLRFGSDGVARRGLLVRHLVLPGLLAESEGIFGWLADDISPDTFVNIMAQYHPAHKVGRSTNGSGVLYEEINRRLDFEELALAYDMARRAGLWRFDERRMP